MPKLPKNMFAFEDKNGKQKLGQAGLCDFEGVYQHNIMPFNIVSNIAGIGDAVENEIVGKRLFLDTLTQMIHDDGGTTDAVQAFRDAAEYYVAPPPTFDFPRVVLNLPRLYSSQTMLSLHHFPITPLEKKCWRHVGPPETTTSYGFEFMLPSLSNKGPKGHALGYYQLDNRVFETLEKYQVPAANKQAYLEGFVRMASMAEHDYLHQIVTIIGNSTGMQYPEAMINLRGNRGPHIQDLEKHVLALHAQICHRLFTEEKPATDGSGKMIAVGVRRKDAVLKWAASEFKVIADMQDTALAHATTGHERAEIREAVTYLAEIYAHRLFRVISPLDPDLKKRITLKGETTATSVAEQCDRMVFAMPSMRATKDHRQGLAGLQTLCEITMDDLYVRSHTAETTSIITRFLEISGAKFPLRKEEMTHHMLADRFVREGVPEMKWKKKVEEEAQQKGGTEIG